MTPPIPGAKVGRDCTQDELKAYNISVHQDLFPANNADFLNNIDYAILNSPPGTEDPNVSDTTALYLGYLAPAISGPKSMLDRFIHGTMALLGFNENPATIRCGHSIDLTVCGYGNLVANSNLCLFHTHFLSPLLLAINEDKISVTPEDVEAQVIAQAIMAFHYNSDLHMMDGRKPVKSKTIPYILMIRTRPTFYLVPVTKELSTTLMNGGSYETSDVLGQASKP